MYIRDRPDHPAVTEAVASARCFDVNLADHRSSRLSPDRIDTLDVGFLMEASGFHLLSNRYPAAVDRAFLPSGFADGAGHPPFVVAPYGRGREWVDEVYATGVDAVDGLIDVVREERASASRLPTRGVDPGALV